MSDEIKEILYHMKTTIDDDNYFEINEESAKLLYNYITNLQHTEDLYNQLLKDYDELQKENEDINKKWQEDKKFIDNRTKEWLEYKTRIDKAIETLGNIPINANGSDILEYERKTYHILQGENNEI